MAVLSTGSSPSASESGEVRCICVQGTRRTSFEHGDHAGRRGPGPDMAAEVAHFTRSLETGLAPENWTREA
jgi:hypothetical protein